MSRIYRVIGTGLIVMLIIIQFFHPEKNSAPVDPAGDMLQIMSASDQIETLFTKACYDCHSNHTDYPWYNHISPVSWYLNSHIKKGKQGLNFSEFESKDRAERIGMLVKTCEVVESGAMPPQSYRLFHSKARLSVEERLLICEWTEEKALEAMRE
jgi:hypothetical protein